MNGLAGVTGICKVEQMDAEWDHTTMTDDVGFEQEPQEEIITPDIPHPDRVEATNSEADAEREFTGVGTGIGPEEEPEVADKVDTPEVPQVGDETVDTVNYGRGMRHGLAPDSVNITTLTEEDVWVLTQLTVKKGWPSMNKLL